LDEWKKTLPKPDGFPATLNHFLLRIVKAKTPSDAIKRLRDFFRAQYDAFPNARSASECDQQASAFAANMIQKIKDGDKTGGYFTESKWLALGGCYLDWWKSQKSAIAKENVRKRK